MEATVDSKILELQKDVEIIKKDIVDLKIDSGIINNRVFKSNGKLSLTAEIEELKKNRRISRIQDVSAVTMLFLIIELVLRLVAK